MISFLKDLFSKVLDHAVYVCWEKRSFYTSSIRIEINTSNKKPGVKPIVWLYPWIDEKTTEYHTILAYIPRRSLKPSLSISLSLIYWGIKIKKGI